MVGNILHVIDGSAEEFRKNIILTNNSVQRNYHAMHSSCG